MIQIVQASAGPALLSLLNSSDNLAGSVLRAIA
jgi:hypothetical protein